VKCILNLLKHALPGFEEAVCMKGLNFAVANLHSNIHMKCAVESFVSKFPQTMGMEFRWEIRSVLRCI
jgi:hypothetical protein